MTDDRALSRRALLATTAGATTLSLAGCSGGSDTTPDTESNDTPNDTPEGNDTESGPGSDDSEDSPEVRVSATLRDSDGGALEAVRLGDRTANGTTQQRVAVAVQTNQDSAQYTATVDDTTLSTGSGGVTDGTYTDAFDLTYGALLEAVGPGEFELTLSATAAGETASDAAPLSLAPPGITIDAPDSLALQEGGSVTLAPRFDTIVDTEYTPTVEYEMTVGGGTVQFTDETDLSYSQVAEQVGEDLDPDGEVTAQVTAESAPRTQDVTLDLSLADIQASLDAPDTLGEHTEATLDIDAGVETTYTLSIGGVTVADGEHRPDQGAITVTLDYEQLIEEVEPGQHPITLATQTRGTQTHDLGQITLEEPTLQQEYGDPERWLRMLEVFPNDGSINPNELQLSDIGLIKEMASDQVLDQYLFNEDGRNLLIPRDLAGDGQLFHENLLTQAGSFGNETSTISAFFYDDEIKEESQDRFFDELDIVGNYGGQELYEDPYVSDIVCTNLDLGSSTVYIKGQREVIENAIHAANSSNNMRGELGLETDIDGQNVPNEILSEGPPLITLSGKNDAPEHSRWFYSDRDSFPREEMDFFAMFQESEGRFRDTAVDLKEDGTYEIVASPFDEEYPDRLPIDPYIQDYNGM